MNKIEGYSIQNGEPTPDNPVEIRSLDIEKDIKFIDEIIKEYNTFGDLDNTDYEDTDRIYKAIENILKKIKELEEENEKNIERYEERDNEVWERVKQCKNMQTEIDRLYIDKKELQQAYLHEKLAKEEVEELLEESIPKQKVKDKIENLKEQRRILGFKTYLRIEDMLNDDKAIMHEISTLEELLEESK